MGRRIVLFVATTFGFSLCTGCGEHWQKTLVVYVEVKMPLPAAENLKTEGSAAGRVELRFNKDGDLKKPAPK